MIPVRIVIAISISMLLALALPDSAVAREADLVIVNAKVRTIDQKNPSAEAVAIRDNKIVSVGSNRDIRKLASRTTTLIDAKGRLVLPGFNDSHVHFGGIGNQFSGIDLRFARSPQDVIDKMKHYVRFLPKGRWILGGQWDHENWPGGALPTKELIDAVTPDNPVFIYHKNGKMAWANSLALKIAKVTKTRGDLRGGLIVRDQIGEPTGILKDNAVLFVKIHAPKFATKNWYEVLQTATNYAASLGVTSVQDVHSDFITDVLTKLLNDGKLKTRVYDCTPLIRWKELADKGIKRANGTGMIRNGCLKSLIDSGEGTKEQLYEEIKAADNAGLQVMIHSIGRRSNENILDVFERVAKENGKKDRRFRVEHAYRFRPEDLTRFGTLGVLPSLQPHLFYGGDPYRSLLDANARIVFGSDASMTDFDPMYGIYDAVRARGSNEAITVEEAVYLYTMGSAYGEFQENVKGSLTPGKLADLVILSDDIFSIRKEDIRKTKVLMTVVDGKIVYRNGI